MTEPASEGSSPPGADGKAAAAIQAEIDRHAARRAAEATRPAAE